MEKINLVDLRLQYLSIRDEIDQSIRQTLENATFIGGAPVRNFEAAFSEYCQCDHVVGCANGTDAIELALKALEIGKGDEVLVPAHTWISTAGAVANVGAIPVFCDTLPGYYTISPLEIATRITSRTKAIVPVHLYGLPCNMEAIMELAEKHRLKVIEDCAQAHGAAINGKQIATFGDVATFSFYPGKNLGAYGDAGAVATHNSELAHRMRMLAHHGQLKKHQHLMVGRNSRLDALQAGILSVKLKHLPAWTQKRIKIAQQYHALLSGLPVEIQKVPPGYQHVYHLYVIRVNASERNALKTHLEKRGIGTAIHYPRPLHVQEAFKGLNHQANDFPNATRDCDEILSLPFYPELRPDQMAYIAESIQRFFA